MRTFGGGKDLRMIKQQCPLRQTRFCSVKSHLLGTGPLCTRTQVGGGWRCPLLCHQVYGKPEGGCPGAQDVSLSTLMAQAGLWGGDRGRLSSVVVLSFYCPGDLMGLTSSSVLWEAVLFFGLVPNLTLTSPASSVRAYLSVDLCGEDQRW